MVTRSRELDFYEDDEAAHVGIRATATRRKRTAPQADNLGLTAERVARRAHRVVAANAMAKGRSTRTRWTNAVKCDPGLKERANACIGKGTWEIVNPQALSVGAAVLLLSEQGMTNKLPVFGASAPGNQG